MPKIFTIQTPTDGSAYGSEPSAGAATKPSDWTVDTYLTPTYISATSNGQISEMRCYANFHVDVARGDYPQNLPIRVYDEMNTLVWQGVV